MGAVEPKEFLDPCKAVATLQIARDVRRDTPVQLHALLINLPKDIQDYVQALQTTTTSNNDDAINNNNVTAVEDLNASILRDYSVRIPKELLEMDWMEQVQTIQTFQDIVKRQREARQQLLHLLIKSRCQFGSHEAAALFHQLETTHANLQTKKLQLADALELEGLDDVVLQDKTNNKTLEDAMAELTPLPWYKANTAGTGAGAEGGEEVLNDSAKRQKIEL